MGFGIEGDITKIYNTYVQKHPECSVLSPDAIYLRMKEEGVITQEQYNTIKRGLIFDFKSQTLNRNNDWKSALGLETATKNGPKQYIIQKTYHPVYKDLLLDSKGKIDMNQFSIETIKQKYPEGKYIIEYKKSDDKFSYEEPSIEIKDKTGKKILSCSYYSDGSISQTSYKSGKEFNSYQIKNGIVISCKHTKPDGNFVQYTYEKDGKTVCKNIKGNKDRYIEKIYKNKDLIRVVEKDIKLDSEIITYYSHGIKTAEFINNKCVDFILNMMDNIFERDKNGYVNIHAGNVQNLIKALDKDNITDFLSNYEHKNNISFTEFLIKSKGHDQNKLKEKLLNHIEKCLYEHSNYEPNKKIINDQIDNDNYISKNIYNVQYNGKKVIIDNKTTGKKSILDFDELLKFVKYPERKITLMIQTQKLPAEILEFCANEGVTLDGETTKGNKAGSNWFGIIQLKEHATNRIYIHEIMHSVDYQGDEWTSKSKKFQEAFELGLKRYETAGYGRYHHETTKNDADAKEIYYFSTNEKECWSCVGEMLYDGRCEGQEILKKFWPEFIELEKQAIAEIQSKPDNERHY